MHEKCPKWQRVNILDEIKITREIRHMLIRINHEFEGGIEKSVMRITDWHHEACRVMTNGDREGRIFLSHPNKNNGLFFLFTTKCLILKSKNVRKVSGKSLLC